MMRQMFAEPGIAPKIFTKGPILNAVLKSQLKHLERKHQAKANASSSRVALKEVKKEMKTLGKPFSCYRRRRFASLTTMLFDIASCARESVVGQDILLQGCFY